MIEIECPKCHTVFEEDESKFASIVKQVRDREFQRELEAHIKLMEDAKASAVAQAQAELRSQLMEEISQKDLQIARLRQDQELLNQQQDRLKQQYEAQAQLAIREATSSLERERDSFKHKAELAQVDVKRLESSLEETKRESARNVEQAIRMKDEEIERLKNFQSKLTIKMIGESLEQHCEIEFNKWRSAFPYAQFGKDNTVTDHSKGDYVFRDFDEQGVEYLSIMFEMKNEEEHSTNRKRNQDHFDKLDRDRTNKKCEYAVLVSTLERDNDFYNQGIVDVSAMSGHERMYVIRPQFFIPLLTFLQSVAKGSLQYRQTIKRLQEESIDIAFFNQALGEFKEGFGRDYEHAAKKLDGAIEGIDKAIKQLEAIKESFRLTETHLSRANKKAEDLTIKRLTCNSPLLAERFAALPEQGQAMSAEEASETSDAGLRGLEPDAIEPPARTGRRGL